MRDTAARSKAIRPLLMRVGINTGEVVVRSIRKDDLAYRLRAGGAFDESGRPDGTAGDTGLDPGHRVHPQV